VLGTSTRDVNHLEMSQVRHVLQLEGLEEQFNGCTQRCIEHVGEIQ
jgi:hypothetical protein